MVDFSRLWVPTVIAAGTLRWGVDEREDSADPEHGWLFVRFKSGPHLVFVLPVATEPP